MLKKIYTYQSKNTLTAQKRKTHQYLTKSKTKNKTQIKTKYKNPPKRKSPQKNNKPRKKIHHKL